MITQKERILDYLNRFGAITPMEAFQDLGITKLATRISELKKDGVKFDQKNIQVKNRYGRVINYMCYRLSEDQD